MATDLDDISTSELESSLTQISIDINAATFQQLRLIAEFNRRQAWKAIGVRSCAHWLNWRCGISLVAAREKVRVAHALEKLPKTSDAFASGQLSYSKARAITRVGTPDNEDCLLTYARQGSASYLDKAVRLYRRQFDSAGNMKMKDQEVAAHEHLTTEKTQAQPAKDEDSAEFQREAKNAWRNLDSRQLWWKWDDRGCLNIRAQLSAEQGALLVKALEMAMESVKQSEPSVDSDSHAIERSNRTNTTVEKLSDKEKRKLRYFNERRQRADSLTLIASSFLGGGKADCNTIDRYQVVVHIDSEVLSKKSFESTSGKPDCFVEKQVALPVETARRLCCSSKLVTALTNRGEPLNIGRSSRSIPTAIKRALEIRDGHCRFPGCDCNKYLEAHHIQHWADGGETSLENLVQVCHFHHKLLHEGQFLVQRQADGKLLFNRPDGQELNSEVSIASEGKAALSLPTMDTEGWGCKDDSLDYSIAVNQLASTNQLALHSPGSS